MAKAIIGCSLPHGIILEVEGEKVQLNGLNTLDREPVGLAYVETQVDADFWASWKKSHSDFAPIHAGAIIEIGSAYQAHGPMSEEPEEQKETESVPQKPEKKQTKTRGKK